MKKLLLLSFAFLGSISVFGQDIAMDWTRTACGTTNEHHLFAELDSGHVIIIDLVMMGCASCIEASDALSIIYDEYKQSHPDRVRFYSVGFNNSTTCPLLLNWKTANGYKHPVFEKGSAETSYYGGMGMPTVVILGGGMAHKVYYNNLGYAPSEDPAIKAAIDLALTESTVTAVEDLAATNLLPVFPNPFGDVLTVSLANIRASLLTLTDPSGRVFLRQELGGSGNSGPIEISTKALPAGVWFLGLYDGEQRIALQKVVKN